MLAVGGATGAELRRLIEAEGVPPYWSRSRRPARSPATIGHDRGAFLMIASRSGLVASATRTSPSRNSSRSWVRLLRPVRPVAMVSLFADGAPMTGGFPVPDISRDSKK